MAIDQSALEVLLEPSYVRAVDEGRYLDALTIVFFACLAARGEQDKETEKNLLGLLKSTIELALNKEQGIDETKCSFCEARSPDARPIGGLEAYICSSCAAQINSYFREGIGS